MSNDTPISIVTNFNGSRIMHWSLGTSYLSSNRVTFNLSGTDDNGNTYSAVGYFNNRKELIVNNIVKK